MIATRPCAALFPSLHGYQGAWLRGDLIAGLTVWAVLIPEALAYASIAGVSPVVGLYAAPGALILYAALGSSRHLITGPMSATAALSAATVADVVARSDDKFVTMTTALAIATGIAALLAGLLRLGFLAGFISEPVIKGFIVGLALTIIIGQVPDLLGIPKGSGNFFEKLWDVVSDLGDIHVLTLVVGLLSLAIVLGLRRTLPAVPGSLVAVAAGILLVYVFALEDHGVDIVGTIDSGLPVVRPARRVAARLRLARRGRDRRDARRLRRGARRGEDVRAARALRHRRQPRAARARRREPRVRPLLRDGRQRLALEDRGQRVGRARTPSSPGCSSPCSPSSRCCC